MLRLFLLLFLCLPVQAQSRLDEIVRRGLLRVGTTGDYPPFTLLSEGNYQGFDIQLAARAAQRLGVRVEYVPTRWASLLEDLGADRFDLAAGGITRTLERARRAGFTRPLATVGKCPLVRRGEEARFASEALVDRPEVRVAFNPGGTNESYARAHFPHAQLVRVDDNLTIPEKIAGGAVDVLVTDSLEAARASRLDARLAVASPPWTQETLGWMTGRDDQAFLNWLNLFLEECEGDGTLKALRAQFQL